MTGPDPILAASDRNALRRAYVAYFGFLGTTGPYLSLYLGEGLGPFASEQAGIGALHRYAACILKDCNVGACYEAGN